MAFSMEENDALDPIAMVAPRFDTRAPEPGSLAYLIKTLFRWNLMYFTPGDVAPTEDAGTSE
jgi:hypothetical protein